MNKLIARVLPPLLSGLLGTGGAYALQGTATGSLGVDFTDNATLSSSNEISDQIVVLQVGGALAKNEGAVTGQAKASVSHTEYVDDTFGKRNYLNVGSSLNWQPVKGRVSVNVQDYFTQTAVDNLSPDVPTNRQNTNAFATSAGISFPVFRRHNLSVSPSFRDYKYSRSNADNQQTGLSAAWAYQFRPTMQFSASAGFTRVEYDSSASTDYDSKNFSLGVSGTTARTRYSASIGKTQVDSDALADNEGITGSLSVNFAVSGRSSLKAYLSQAITSTSDLFLGYAIDPDTGDIVNVQISGEAVHNRSMRLTYNRTGTAVNSTFWTELRELDYGGSTADRETQEFGGRLGYSISPLVNASLNASYRRNEETGTSVVQKTRSIGVGLGYKLSRRLSASFGVIHNSRDHPQPTSEYDELSISAKLGYKIWP